jgi:hypothetical protein
MAVSDDEVYRRNVKVMSVILAAIVLTVFAAIFIPPVLSPVRKTFPSGVTEGSPFGFLMGMRINATHFASGSSVSISFWLNDTTADYVNLTAADSFQFGELWTPPCYGGFPAGVTVMAGYFTQDNVSLGEPLQLPMAAVLCPVNGPPLAFLFQSHSAAAVVKLDGSLVRWDLVGRGVFAGTSTPAGTAAFRGVYTVVLADEWGDVLVAHFDAA